MEVAGQKDTSTSRRKTPASRRSDEAPSALHELTEQLLQKLEAEETDEESANEEQPELGSWASDQQQPQHLLDVMVMKHAPELGQMVEKIGFERFFGYKKPEDPCEEDPKAGDDVRKTTL